MERTADGSEAELIVMDKCSSYETGRIAPGQSHNFKVSCGGCRDSIVAPYDHYTIAIVDAHYVPSSK